jgi:hypothetical protein
MTDTKGCNETDAATVEALRREAERLEVGTTEGCPV